MKLTKEARAQIVENIVGATDLPDLKEALKKSMDKFANEYARSFIDKKFIAATANLPREWFRTVVSFSISPEYDPVRITRYVPPGVPKERWMIDYPVEAFHAPMNINIPSIYKKADPENVPAKLRPLIAEANAISEREHEMRRTLEATLVSFTTVEKLIADFPEFERHCPKPPTKTYPVAVNTQPVIDMLVAAGFDKSLKTPKPAAKPAKTAAKKAPAKRRTASKA